MNELSEEWVLSALKCPGCSKYMAPPIRQCTTGHSFCEPCRSKSKVCTLCKSDFTESRNLALEALTKNIRYPCTNAGCLTKMSLKNRDEHEINCSFRNYKCALTSCSWSGPLHKIAEHWEQKKLCKSYKTTNTCQLRLANYVQLFNLISANNELYWYKFKLSKNFLYFAVQYIGPPNKAQFFYYEVEIFKRAEHKQRLILKNYCQSLQLSNRDLFNCCYISLDSLDNFIKPDDTINYILRVCVADVGQNENAKQPLSNHVNYNAK